MTSAAYMLVVRRDKLRMGHAAPLGSIPPKTTRGGIMNNMSIVRARLLMRRRSASVRAGSLMSPWNVIGRPTFLGPSWCLPCRRPRFPLGGSSSLPVRLSVRPKTVHKHAAPGQT